MDFLEWIRQEMNTRQMGNNELGRRGKLASSTVSDVLNGKMRVNYKFCKGVAKAFRLPLEDVLRKANLLPPAPGDAEGNMSLRELWSILQTMNHDQLRAVRQYARFLAANGVDSAHAVTAVAEQPPTYHSTPAPTSTLDPETT